MKKYNFGLKISTTQLEMLLYTCRPVELNDWYYCPHRSPGNCTWRVNDENDSLMAGFTYTFEIEANNSVGAVMPLQYSIDTSYIGKSEPVKWRH